MAKNLRAKIPASDKLVVCDRNPQATDNFVQAIGKGSSSESSVQVVKTPRQVAEQSVSTLPPPIACQLLPFCMMSNSHS